MNQTNWVGVDTHKESLACYKNGKFKEFKTNQKGFEEAIKWAGIDSLWAIEGAYCFGKPFTAYLIKNGCEVYEVNPLLTKTWRRIIDISNPKNDYGDAKVISLYANKDILKPISLDTIFLKEKLSARQLAVKQRTKTINAIKMLYSTRGESLPLKNLTTKKAGKWLSNQNDIVIRTQGIILQTLNAAIKEFDKDIEKNLPEEAQRLLPLKGVGIISAAIFYAETKGKVSSSASLAKYAGVAPVENSSGKSRKYKNNKTGNRRLNCALYRLSLHQSRYDKEGKKYYEKKLAEGKSPRHARKCLARRLVDIIFKILND